MDNKPTLRDKILAVLSGQSTAIGAADLAKLIHLPSQTVKNGLRTAREADVVHVAGSRRCLGGRKFLYRAGPKP